METCISADLLLSWVRGSMWPMAQKIRPGDKINVNFAVDPQLAERFREAAKPYLGRLSMCFSAALAMWLAADPEEQGRWLKRVYEAEIEGQVQQLIAELCEEQSQKVKHKKPRAKN